MRALGGSIAGIVKKSLCFCFLLVVLCVESESELLVGLFGERVTRACTVGELTDDRRAGVSGLPGPDIMPLKLASEI